MVETTADTRELSNSSAACRPLTATRRISRSTRRWTAIDGRRKRPPSRHLPQRRSRRNRRDRPRPRRPSHQPKWGVSLWEFEGTDSDSTATQEVQNFEGENPEEGPSADTEAMACGTLTSARCSGIALSPVPSRARHRRAPDGDRDAGPTGRASPSATCKPSQTRTLRPSAPAGPETCTVSKPSTWRPTPTNERRLHQLAPGV
ncbi:hypothetical protein C8039_03140 [Halogeometricum sp. wsp3]|nr:hypothetical protein C8039_03140 [Halogeometricum sp. wsp3]